MPILNLALTVETEPLIEIHVLSSSNRSPHSLLCSKSCFRASLGCIIFHCPNRWLCAPRHGIGYVAFRTPTFGRVLFVPNVFSSDGAKLDS